MKFFTYGIFLDFRTRRRWGLLRPAHYATVRGYSTVGDNIVYAIPAKSFTLTGLVLDVTEADMRRIDGIELSAGYKRIKVKTTDGDKVQMYIMEDY